MTSNHPTTTISKLFNDRRRIDAALGQLWSSIDRLESQTLAESQLHRELLGYYQELCNRMAAVDAKIAAAEITGDGDRFIVAIVAQWRMAAMRAELQGGQVRR